MADGLRRDTAQPPLRTCSRTAAMPSCSLLQARATAAGTILAVSLAGERQLRRLGTYIYLHTCGGLWSAGLQPSGVDPDAMKSSSTRTELSSSAATEA